MNIKKKQITQKKSNRKKEKRLISPIKLKKRGPMVFVKMKQEKKF